MGTQRKILVITRHGKKQGNDDRITDESVGNLYRNTGGDIAPFVQEEGINPSHAFLRRSDRDRTRQTGKAILAGAFGITPAPNTVQEIEDLHISGLEDSIDLRLDYRDLKFNMNLIERVGNTGYLGVWLGNPDAASIEGVEVTSFSEMVRRQRACLIDTINYLEKGKHIGVLASHCPIIEPVVVAAINSGRSDSPVEALEDFGGPFVEEEFTKLVIDYHSRSGTYLSAHLERKGQIYAVDINKLRDLEKPD